MFTFCIKVLDLIKYSHLLLVLNEISKIKIKRTQEQNANFTFSKVGAPCCSINVNFILLHEIAVCLTDNDTKLLCLRQLMLMHCK